MRRSATSSTRSRCGRCPAVVTIHDLSFERDPSLMGRKDRLVFKTVVPRAARRAKRVLTVSERTRQDQQYVERCLCTYLAHYVLLEAAWASNTLTEIMK